MDQPKIIGSGLGQRLSGVRPDLDVDDHFSGHYDPTFQISIFNL